MDTKSEHRDSMFSEALAAMVAKNYGVSVNIFSALLTDDPKNTKFLMIRGTAYLKLGDVESATNDFNRAIEQEPENAHARHLRGLSHEKQGDNIAALIDFNRAIDLNPEYGAAYFSRATLHTKLGYTDEATEDIAMVTHLTNANIESFANQNNVWRSNHMRVETMLENDYNR